jgi:hypothetical protein
VQGDGAENHEEFMWEVWRLEKYLKRVMPFSQTIKERYPESSKKRTSGSKERGRLKGR